MYTSAFAVIYDCKLLIEMCNEPANIHMWRFLNQNQNLHS